MAQQSAINPAPIVITPIFIPENWSVIAPNTSVTTISTAVSTKIVGEIISYTGLSVPTSNWLWCDGTLYSTTSYSELFSVIGFIYGSSTVANPASSSTSAGNDIAYTATTITETSSYNYNSGNKSSWTIVIPSNTAGGGAFTISSPIYISTSGTFTTFGSPGSTLTVTNTITSIQYNVYKDAVLFSSGTATAVSGAVNPFVYTVTTAPSTISSFQANNNFGNYLFSFTPAVQSTSSTYTIFYTLNYATSGSVSGGSVTYSVSSTPKINSSVSSPSTSATSCVVTITSTTPSGYSAVSATWVGNTFFKVPNMCSNIIVGSSGNTSLTTSYGGSPVTFGGNKTMNIPQLAGHNHAVVVLTGFGMLQSLSQNNSIQGIGAGTTSVVQDAVQTPTNYTATAGNEGNNIDILPPFSVCNFLIRAN